MTTIPLQATPPGTGAIAQFLSDIGVPYPDAVGSAITFVLVFVVLYLAGRLAVLPVLERVMDRRGFDQHLKRPFRRLAMVVVVFAAIGVAFAFAGFGNILTSLATIAAAATLAIGFALQDVLKNFVAGVFIYTDKPFRIGDWIEWDSHSGIVEDISFRVTRVRTFDNELLTVPNSALTDDVLKNPVAKDKLRLKFVFGIGYDDDIDQATDIIVEEAENHPEILDDPAPSVRLTELADSYVGLQSRVWIANPSRADFVKTRAEYVKTVKERFDEASIDIPYPQRDLSGGLELAGAVRAAEAAGDAPEEAAGDD